MYIATLVTLHHKHEEALGLALHWAPGLHVTDACVVEDQQFPLKITVYYVGTILLIAFVCAMKFTV